MKKSITALCIAAGLLGSSLSFAAAPAATAPAAPAAATAPAAPAASTAPAAAAATKAPANANGTPMAQAPGGGADKVWVNDSSKVYHCPDDKFYGKTKKGNYLTEAEAKTKGFKADHGKACAK